MKFGMDVWCVFGTQNEGLLIDNNGHKQEYTAK